MSLDQAPQPDWVRCLGQGPRQVLAVHCSLAHSGEWRGLAEHLGGAVTITAFDLPGHGRAPGHDPARDLGDQATEMGQAVLDGMAGPVDLIGHSFGAVIALRLAIENPGRIRSLTLIEPTLYAAAIHAGLPELPEFEARMRPLFEAFAAGDTVRAAQIFTGDWGTGAAWADLPEAQRAYIAERIGLVEVAEPVLRHDSGRVLDRLGQIRCPVLLLGGAATPSILGRVLALIEAGLTGTTTTLVTVPGAGHMLPVTHAAEVAAAIGGFLSRV
ncbi:hypothetical protein U879_10375 [Defluviimonas sp. 20V17]|uniref:Pimeloyl-ACP methyl ester carboxylesterase n=1 Tax=Allgaiera indica TaxID=765699 RepID=A0AAN4UQ39_9RHOB|nr:alpha/beta hydrolase [Allgaiera indica]KDB03784.1 hypothetical protein U879_10375 [Defluviimonas sp. 20V17]GHD99941.1 hypothetical protein GCM10008024_09670 [Allgaiera indica]SDW40196.1 Pimeloyl-ACP methyl ester carboxylesterase [Allgaiera indica]